MESSTGTIVYSKPGNDEVFTKVSGKSVAGQSFIALETGILESSIWLTEANNDSVKIEIITDDLYGGFVLASGMLPPGGMGKRTVVFTRPIFVDKNKTYCLRVSSGAPGLNMGAVARGERDDATQGYIQYKPVADNMALEVVFKQWEGEQPAAEEPMMLEEGYEESVNWALSHGTDVWGERLMALPEGPTYQNIKDYLKPIMHCGTMLTESGIYYLHFGKPVSLNGGGPVALHVADGSQIISNYFNQRKITIQVGFSGTERYGASLKRLQGPYLEEGYLPILKTEYTDSDGVRYRQESFSNTIAETSSLVSFVKITVNRNGSKRQTVSVRCLISDEELSSEGNKLVLEQQTYMVFGGTTVYRDSALTYAFDLSDGEDKIIYLARLNDPAECTDFIIDEERYQKVKADIIWYWNDMLAQGAVIDVPEDLVMNAKKNLLIQNLYLGWRYSVGNAYETFYQPESSDMAVTLGMYGYTGRQQACLETLIDMWKPNRPYPNWERGEKLSHVAQYYYFTKDSSLLAEFKDKYAEFCLGTIEQLQTDPNGLVFPQVYSGDIQEKAYYLHQQTVVWRGLRDIGQLWGVLGDQDLQDKCLSAAAGFKRALESATEQSEVELEDGTLFIPTTVLSQDKSVFDPITATTLGSYWNICMPYALVSGLYDYESPRMKKAYRFLQQHGSWLLGMFRFNYYPTAIGAFTHSGLAGYKTTGVDNVYGLSYAELFAQLDDADRLVLAFYGKLAHGMTRDTYIAGEGDSVGVYPGEYYRSCYLPPSGANNSLFLKLLRFMLITETTDAEGRSADLRITHATPRGWLEHGKTIRVSDAPTLFGTISFTVSSCLSDHYIDIALEVPSRDPITRLSVKLRTPGCRQIASVTVNGSEHDAFDSQQEKVDLTCMSGRLEIRVTYLDVVF